jgi:hypothetical protein
MDMTVRLGSEPALWSRGVADVESSYRMLGLPIGVLIAGGALLTTMILAFAVRTQPTTLRLTVLALVCLVGAQVLLSVFVAPVNHQMIDWTPDHLPGNFEALRKQWEYAHAAGAVLQLIRLGALVLSVRGTGPVTDARPAQPKPRRLQTHHTPGILILGYRPQGLATGSRSKSWKS